MPSAGHGKTPCVPPLGFEVSQDTLERRAAVRVVVHAGCASPQYLPYYLPNSQVGHCVLVSKEEAVESSSEECRQQVQSLLATGGPWDQAHVPEYLLFAPKSYDVISDCLGPWPFSVTLKHENASAFTLVP